MKKEKLLIISQCFWPEKFPINQIAFNLIKIKKFDILTGYPNYPFGKFFSDYKYYKFSKESHKNISIYRVPIFSRGKKNKFRLLINYFSFILSSIICSMVYLRKKKYSHVLVFATSPIFQAYIGLFYKWFYKSKFIIWVQDIWPEVLVDTGYIKKNSIIFKLIKFFTIYLYNNADLLLVQSEGFKKIISKRTRTDVKILYNCGDENFNRKKLIKKSNTINILYAGNIGSAQPWERLIKSFSKITNANKLILKIAGDGNKKSDLLKEISNIKNIKYLGFLGQKKLQVEYNQADFLLLMLDEGSFLNQTIPSKFQNYLFLGKPVVAICGGQTKDIILKNNLGYVVKNHSIKEIYKTLIKCSKINNKISVKMKKNINLFYEKNFSIKKITKNLIQLVYG